MLRTLLLIALVLGLAAVGGWMAFVRHDRVAPPGEELLFDDFGFSVKGVQQAKTFGPPERSVTATGTFWIVDLQVANHAKRVGYKLDSHQVAMVDESGTPIPESKGAEASLPPNPAEIAHGETCITRHVFDVPESVRAPRLKIRFGDVGSTLDYVLLGDWSLELRRL